MQYRKLTGIDKKASGLVYGTVPSVAQGDCVRAFEDLDRAWEAGFRTFDTAPAYGMAEETFGKWIESRGVRDELVLLDKDMDTA